MHSPYPFLSSRLLYRMAVCLALATVQAHAQDLILEQYELLIENPRHKRAAKQIGKYARDNPTSDRAPLLIGSYAITQLLNGNAKAHQSAQAYLKKRYPNSPVREQITADTFLAKCSKCGGGGTLARDCSTCAGSGNCQRCDGKGKVSRDSFEGATSNLMCLVCKGSKQCRNCKGRRKFVRRCDTCGGRGKNFSKEKAEKVLVGFLQKAKS